LGEAGDRVGCRAGAPAPGGEALLEVAPGRALTP
jgi:hypothetical protein